MSSDYYKMAARALQHVLELRRSIKTASLCEEIPVSMRKSVFAIICEVVKYKELLLETMESTFPGGFSKFLERNNISRELALCACHDLLLKKGGIRCGGRLKSAFMPFRLKMIEKFKTRHALRKAEVNNMLKSLPKYARINTNLGDPENIVKELFPLQFALDEHIPNLIVFPPQINLIATELYSRTHQLVIQDKSSCFPAHLLQPPPGEEVIDACAAPGNKTQHLSTIMHNEGRIYAFDLSAHRLKTLETLAQKTKSTIIKPINGDFLKIDPQQYSKVTHILADPSCSGSGMMLGKIDSLVTANGDLDGKRLMNLSQFQYSIIEHAMKFPAVKRISYSTCSIYDEENEAVVQKILRSHPEWQLEHIMPEWPRRGNPVPGFAKEAQDCIRILPEDGSGGFFVVVFVKQ